ncbi:MAG TPA: DUF4235 domain-containing protein [Acidimicrobiia bacterium]|nr:DUF4235 domain-containing protein [Acidimicrobiia bacterium]
MSKNLAWRMLVWVVAAMAVWAAQKATRYTWSRVSSTENPSNPLDESTSWLEAIMFAAVLAAIAALARKGAESGARVIWTKTTGEPPPGQTV